jgi:predicted peroxiredoxin
MLDWCRPASDLARWHRRWLHACPLLHHPGRQRPDGGSLPLHLATNGSLAVGHDVSVVLAGDGSDLARRATREEVHGVGLPHLRDLFAALVEHQVPVYV